MLKKIIEKPKKGEEPSMIKRIGVEVFSREIFDIYKSLPHHSETDLIDAINIYAENIKIALVKRNYDIPVLKYPWDLFYYF